MARQVIVVALIFMAVVGAFAADAAPSPAPSQAPSSSPSGAPASGPISASPSEGPSAEGSEAEGPDTEGPDAEGPDADGPDVEGPEGGGFGGAMEAGSPIKVSSRNKNKRIGWLRGQMFRVTLRWSKVEEVNIESTMPLVLMHVITPFAGPVAGIELQEIPKMADYPIDTPQCDRSRKT
ncbi:hypothetical protein Golax_002120 [Gossypium laxum]|uniref:Uncharacterized protein n=1 Tax=Gossypium laxum TaxID=34288 RepID=A0A7J9AQP5_9ROSI|nr:hypothetical protein [Gossypium laxum]